MEPSAFVVDLQPTVLQDHVEAVEVHGFHVVGQASDEHGIDGFVDAAPTVLVVFLSTDPEAARDWAVRAKVHAAHEFAVLFVDGGPGALAMADRFLPASLHTTSQQLGHGLKEALAQARQIQKADRPPHTTESR